MVDALNRRQDLFMSPLEVLNWALKKQPSSQLKAIPTRIPFEPSLFLFDIANHSRGGKEDKEFAKDVRLRLNIRRGNTLIVEVTKRTDKIVPPESVISINSVNYEILSISWARRGVAKFFDIKMDYLKQSSTKNLLSHGSFMGNFHSGDALKDKFRKVLFFEMEDALLHQGIAIDIYKTNKANGENAQISYHLPTDAWVIASKNVCLLLRSPEEIPSYNGDRFRFASLIAEAWFECLKTADVPLIKAKLSGHTIIGEYTGNPRFQHLVRYSSIQIVFFAMVNNTSTEIAVPPPHAYYFFKKSGLPHVAFEKYRTVFTLSELYSVLLTLFHEVSAEPIDTGEEGVVLYFVKNNHPNHPAVANYEEFITQDSALEFPEEEFLNAVNEQSTVSIGKLKTLEYRIFRKLREKIKEVRRTDSDKLYNSFVMQVQGLVTGLETPKPLEYYHSFAEAAFKYIKEKPHNVEGLQDKYLDFLEKIRLKMSGESPPVLSASVSYDNRPISIVLIIPPLYFNQIEIESIAAILHCSQIYYEWREKSSIDTRNLCVVQMNINISKGFRRNSLLVFIGFTDKNKAASIEKLTVLRKDKRKHKNLPPEICSYTSTKEIDTRIDKLFVSVAKTKEFVTENFPDHIIDIEDGSCEEIGNAINSALNSVLFQNVASMPSAVRKPEIKPKNIYVVIPVGISCMGKTYLSEMCKDLIPYFTVISGDSIRKDCMQEYMQKTKNFVIDLAFEKTANSARRAFNDEFKAKLLSNIENQVIFLDKNFSVDAVNQIVDICKTHENVKTIMISPESSTHSLYFEDDLAVFPFSMSLLFQALQRSKTHKGIIGSFPKQVSVILMLYNLFRDTELSAIASNLDYHLTVPFVDESIIPEGNFVNVIERILGKLRVGKCPQESEISEILEYLNTVSFEVPSLDTPSILREKLGEIMELSQNKKERAEYSIKNLLVPIVYGVIDKLSQVYLADERIVLDKGELKNRISTAFLLGKQLSESWYFPEELCTNDDPSSTLDKTTRISHIVYCPSTVICGKVSDSNSLVPLIKSKNQTINLLELSSKVDFSEDISQQALNIEDSDHLLYTFKLRPSIILSII